MKPLRSFIIVFVFTVVATCNFHVSMCLGSDYLKRFSTKHGDLTIVNKEGEFSEPTVEVRLDGKIILTSVGRKDIEGYPQELGVDLILDPYQTSANYKPGKGPIKIDRILISEYGLPSCIRQFVILDFTGEKPFVSERFGLNPGLKYCLELKRVKWGKKKSYIYLEGDEKYIYYTGDRVDDADIAEAENENKQTKKVK